MSKVETVYIKVKSGCLSFDILGQSHTAHKYTEDGKTFYEVWYGGSRLTFTPEQVMEHERFFLVYVVAKATENNPSFAGKVRKYIFGKGDELLWTDSPEITSYFRGYDKLWASDVREYGYTRRQDAKRCYSYTHPEDGEYWKSKAYVVEYDVCGNEVREV